MENLALNFEGVEALPLHHFTKKAYLDYSMYVILDRALPAIADGLKPVQRRIVYAMSELGLKNGAKHKKSARTVGDVLGKYHPHGDQACYEAMVLMAQSFSYRYPLVDGQGNWGSTDDPKSFAAMRYTESRLSPYADLLLGELGQGTVEWAPNFDGTLTEPVLLPAQVPNILLNGAMGIAVGMATDIPPHNLNEVVSACLHLLKHPEASLEDLMEFIQGPDYPTGGEMTTPRKDIMQAYQTGSGSVKLRAKYHLEEHEIVITELPHQTSGAQILMQIAEQIQSKKLTLVTDLRDESDHENPVRLVITPRSQRVDVDTLMAHLFATTGLERNYRINLNMIGLDGRPQVKNLCGILSEWLEFRLETIRLRLKYRLNKVLGRLHILEGLMIAYLNLDEVIRIIRHEEEPKQVMIAQFNITEEQAEAILDLKLRHLAKLEEFEIRREQSELEEERKHLEETLGSETALKNLVASELKEVQKRFSDPRRSVLVARQESKPLNLVDMMPAEPVTIILSKLGWIRAAKGHQVDGSSLSYKAGDSHFLSINGRSNHVTVFMDSEGRTYSLTTHELPSARGQGEPLTGYFAPKSQVSFVAMANAEPEQKCVVGSTAGYGFVSPLSEMVCKNKAGKQHLSVGEEAQVLPILFTEFSEKELLVLVTLQGRCLAFPVSELPELGKGKGNKTIAIEASELKDKSDQVVHWAIVRPQDEVYIHSGKQYLRLKYSDLTPYLGVRGRRGVSLPKAYRRVTRIEISTLEKESNAPTKKESDKPDPDAFDLQSG